jgi:hypothetical protein
MGILGGYSVVHDDVRTTARYTTPTQADLEQAVEALV